MIENFKDMPLECGKGDTIKFNFDVVDIASDEEFDKIVFAVKKNYDDNTAVVTSSLANGRISRVAYDSDTSTATYVVEGLASETTNLDANSYAYYDIRFEYNGTDYGTLLRGRLHVKPSVASV